MNPQVTIGLPVYNGARYLRSAIDSALAQSFEDFELLIADNASTDNTQAICEEFAARDSRVRYVRHLENFGAFRNFQFVTAEARGRFITWLANDDLLERDFLAATIAFLIGHPEAVLVMTDVTIIDEEGLLTEVEHLESIRSDISWETRIRAFFAYPISNAYLCIYGVMRTSPCQEVLAAMPQPRFVRGLELPILARLAQKGELASLPTALRLYRRHAASLHAGAAAEDSRAGRVKGVLADLTRRAHWQLDHLSVALKLEPHLRRAAMTEIGISVGRTARNAVRRIGTGSVR